MTEIDGKEILSRFGKKLEEIKERKKLSYRKIATRCNIDHSDIKKYVDGKISPSILTVVELAKGLGVHPTELFDFDFGVDFSAEEEL